MLFRSFYYSLQYFSSSVEISYPLLEIAKRMTHVRIERVEGHRLRPAVSGECFIAMLLMTGAPFKIGKDISKESWGAFRLQSVITDLDN